MQTSTPKRTRLVYPPSPLRREPITDLELPTELADLPAVRIPDHLTAQGATERDQNGISF